MRSLERGKSKLFDYARRVRCSAGAIADDAIYGKEGLGVRGNRLMAA